MNAVVLAGGNQTRLAGFLKEQSKILYPLGGDETVLSNILNQLDAAGVKKIIVRPAEKKHIAEYVSTISPNYNAEIIVDSTAWPSPVKYLIDSEGCLPATFVLGDTYFPEGELQRYMVEAIAGQDNYDGFVGVSKEHVGDARVFTEGDRVIDMSHGFDTGYYTCGVFTIYDPMVFAQLEHLDKFAHTWAQLPKLGYKLGYHMVGPGLIDLDTPDEFAKLPKS